MTCFQKRTAALLLAVALLLPVTAQAAMSAFTTKRLYGDRFYDVSADAWYRASVIKAYELKLMNGKSTYQFQPEGAITAAEAIALAARIHATYYGNTIYLTEGPWYASYVSYVRSHSLLSDRFLQSLSMGQPVSRLHFVQILYPALPASEYTAVHTVGTVPDVPTSLGGADEVRTLYAAGILTGSGGRFYPGSAINRAQAAAVLARMVSPAARR